MEEESELILVCAKVHYANGVERLCSRCGVSIFPNGNNLARVQADRIAMICIDCSLQHQNPVIGGVLAGGEVSEDQEVIDIYKRYKELKTRAASE